MTLGPIADDLACILGATWRVKDRQVESFEINASSDPTEADGKAPALAQVATVAQWAISELGVSDGADMTLAVHRAARLVTEGAEPRHLRSIHDPLTLWLFATLDRRYQATIDSRAESKYFVLETAVCALGIIVGLIGMAFDSSAWGFTQENATAYALLALGLVVGLGGLVVTAPLRVLVTWAGSPSLLSPVATSSRLGHWPEKIAVPSKRSPERLGSLQPPR